MRFTASLWDISWRILIGKLYSYYISHNKIFFTSAINTLSFSLSFFVGASDINASCVMSTWSITNQSVIWKKEENITHLMHLRNARYHVQLKLRMRVIVMFTEEAQSSFHKEIILFLSYIFTIFLRKCRDSETSWDPC